MLDSFKSALQQFAASIRFKFKSLRSYKYVPQIDSRDCGVAALASIAKYYGSDYSLAHLRELAKTSKEGTTALGIVEAAKKMKFETRAIKADMSLFDVEDIPYPFIVHIVKDGKLQHYYVVYGQEKEKVIIGDPDLNCTPKVRQKKSNFWGVFIMKLTYEDKVLIYELRNQGYSLE
ncbi:ABC transporter ATP-binding protein [Streptococcus mutans KK23]|nr:ABC transporter ATP-binding protein [Streptococcus mutans KK23]